MSKLKTAVLAGPNIRSLLGATVLAGGLMLGAGSAHATLQLSLGVGNAAIAGFPSPYGTVDVTRIDPTHALIQFSSLSAPGVQYLFGDGASAGLNVNATTFSVQGGIPGGVTGTNSFASQGFTPGPYSDGGAGQIDGHGNFNFSINSFDGYTSSATGISFTLVNGSATWANDAAVLTPNNDGFLAAAHIFIASVGAGGVLTNTNVTGFAANGGSTNVPEPASLALLGMGVLGLSFMRRRRA